MDGIEALVAIVFAMVPILLRFIARHYRLREKQLLLQAAGDPARIEQLTEQKRRLEARVENLESIVCADEFEVQRRLAGLGGDAPDALRAHPSRAS